MPITITKEIQLHRAALKGEITSLENLVKVQHVDVNHQHEKCKTSALMDAASRGQIQAINFLLTKGANPDLQDAQGNTALHAAILFEKKEAAIVLMRSTDLSIKNNPNQGAEGLDPSAFTRVRLEEPGANRDILREINFLLINMMTYKAIQSQNVNQLQQLIAKYGIADDSNYPDQIDLMKSAKQTGNPAIIQVLVDKKNASHALANKLNTLAEAREELNRRRAQEINALHARHHQQLGALIKDEIIPQLGAQPSSFFANQAPRPLPTRPQPGLPQQPREQAVKPGQPGGSPPRQVPIPRVSSN